ncbi:MAG: ATP-binding protein [Pseudomonadota bacterium]|nr:ATP-binding protein [Pseudomonadota bacterium]
MWTSHDDHGGLVNGPMDAATQEALRLAELGLLTAGLIHELRQPVFAIKALAQLAEGHPSRAPEYLAQVLAQVRTLEALVEGYADFSRRPVGSCEVFELSAPVRSALVVLEHRAVASRVRMHVDLGEAMAVRGSLLAVQQAVVNLGQNALDALRGQEDGCLRITNQRGLAGGTIRVEDNGPGLPDHIRSRLFEPFQTTKPSGTGLGLSISRDLMAACGGELRLVEVTRGTCWEICLAEAA